jgi:hypothetical protein
VTGLPPDSDVPDRLREVSVDIAASWTEAEERRELSSGAPAAHAGDATQSGRVPGPMSIAGESQRSLEQPMLEIRRGSECRGGDCARRLMVSVSREPADDQRVVVWPARPCVVPSGCVPPPLCGEGPDSQPEYGYEPTAKTLAEPDRTGGATEPRRNRVCELPRSLARFSGRRSATGPRGEDPSRFCSPVARKLQIGVES